MNCPDCGGPLHVVVYDQRVVRSVCVPCDVRRIVSDEDRACQAAELRSQYHDAEEWRS